MADQKKYKTFNRSSDLAVKIFGASQAELFANSGFALFDIMTQMDSVQLNEHVTLEVEGTDRDDLMVNWMRELLYLYEGSSFLPKEFVVQEVRDNYIRGEVSGEKFDPDRHEMLREIRAVSAHQGRMEKTGNQWTAQVVLEL